MLIYYQSPFTTFEIQINHQAVQHLRILLDAECVPTLSIKHDDAATLTLRDQVISELDAYFNNAQHLFTLPLEIQGTVFQQRIWQTLREIPVGQTPTYGDLARQHDTAARAIGTACRSNKIPIIIPCHRVVSKHTLGGFMGGVGETLHYKAWLIQHEKGEYHDIAD
jgi:methylated-DNA-[protein]-cysteine S-methyltransferase